MADADRILELAHQGHFKEALPLAWELEERERSSLSALMVGWILGRLDCQEYAKVWARLALVRSGPLNREYAEALSLLVSFWSREGSHEAALRLVPLLFLLPAEGRDRMRRSVVSADALRRAGMARDAKNILLEDWSSEGATLDKIEWRRAYLLAQVDILLDDYELLFPGGHPNQKRFLGDLQKRLRPGEPG